MPMYYQLGTVRLSIAIMLHPKRREHVAKMQATLGAHRAVEVVDEEFRGPWPTARRAWLAADPESTHHVVLQDDLLLCRDFARSVAKALTVKSAEAVSLYANRKIIAEARARGLAWAVIDDGVWGQAMVLPTPLIESFIAHTGATMRDDYPHDDRRLMYFLADTGRRVWCTAPSLVEHALPSDSLMGHSNASRVARWFIGEHLSGTTVDWTKGSDGELRQAVSLGALRAKEAGWFR
jgi:hypothetical protein